MKKILPVVSILLLIILSSCGKKEEPLTGDALPIVNTTSNGTETPVSTPDQKPVVPPSPPEVEIKKPTPPAPVPEETAKIVPPSTTPVTVTPKVPVPPAPVPKTPIPVVVKQEPEKKISTENTQKVTVPPPVTSPATKTSTGTTKK